MRAAQQFFRPVHIVHAQSGARVVAEVELRKVAVQVGFRDVVERPDDAPLFRPFAA